MPVIRLNKETMRVLDKLVDETDLSYDVIILKSLEIVLNCYVEVDNDQD